MGRHNTIKIVCRFLTLILCIVLAGGALRKASVAHTGGGGDCSAGVQLGAAAVPR